jgi:hypothetical protein
MPAPAVRPLFRSSGTRSTAASSPAVIPAGGSREELLEEGPPRARNAPDTLEPVPRPCRGLCRLLHCASGAFVHHVPAAPDPEWRDAEALTRTQRRIVEVGFPVDDALWLAPADLGIPVAAGCQPIVIVPKPKG